ncbi:multifunctional tRNA nucleotidy [Legionella cincinnatiensis]|uniref:Multifunctional tRNA nucleotidy n=1 Tax=Legionella cincinnatiensis TaxID=28085 RepID=A0A378IMV9_9GAMM|nr:multifunctional tRNA nucleotidy [Legionella cincinnatiensis]KTC93421.1 multifunctional tRNA nucleotidy [Legionella cincinnatiensis]STX36578.1 multifunctional tRNA nucleotidy [Legionella cincinnatiensis]
MKIYLVGGAVRDKLLGFHPKDNDWVVVGATRDEMLELGYKPVQNNQGTGEFPVFLHPETNEEYALARLEKRKGYGHGGFEFDTSPSITLVDDLKRRDLTINAMAFPFEEEKMGELIDPYNGKIDLENRILRHISPAFVEDPLRLIRTARFAACLDFEVASETLELMKQMVIENKVSELSKERIWKEMERALMGTHPENFFDVLKKCNADRILFPYIKIPGSGIKAMQRAAEHKNSAQVRFAALMLDLTQEEIIKFCKQFNVPNQYRDLALLATKNLQQFQRLPELEAPELLNLLTNMGAFQNKDRFNECLHVFECYTQESTYIEKIRHAFEAANSINTKELSSQYIGREITRRMRILRVEAIQQYMNFELEGPRLEMCRVDK